MKPQPFRNAAGGAIDRSQPISFTFDGRRYHGYAGDTLASALMANGVKLLGRSFKYHRPRGLMAMGIEEPNALVQLRTGARTEPNIQATCIELFDGLDAESQNRWPSLRYDINAVTGLFGKLFPAGFYYKTFMWPRSFWMTYEWVIRRIAGLGKAPTERDPDRYGHRHAHCDVLVIGAGPTGLAAAEAAARSGARVMLLDANPHPGGALRSQTLRIDGQPGTTWAKDKTAWLERQENVHILRRTMAEAYYDHNLIVAAEHLADHHPVPASHTPRQRLWHIRAKQVVLATGSLERPLVFAGNDLPGVMLASAAQILAVQYAVRAGDRAVVATNNASAYAAAADLSATGVQVSAIVDARDEISDDERAIAEAAQIPIISGHVVTQAIGSKDGVQTARISPTASESSQTDAPSRDIPCDVIAVSGGWTPSVHLFSQSRGKLRYDAERTCFVPSVSFQQERSAGACAGTFQLASCLADGYAAGADAATQAGFPVSALSAPTCDTELPVRPLPIWSIPVGSDGSDKRFVDFQNDVTAEDVALAHREGFRSVEHLKRYTTLGMATDQGRSSNVNGLAIMAALRGEDIPAVGTTTFRPPFTPTTLGTIAGTAIGTHMTPIRRTAMHDWHIESGAPMVPAGAWLRPQAYPKSGETLRDAYLREARHVRQKVGMVDVSTLGKIDVQGADAAEFLNRLYINGFAKLPVGKCRYGVMLREDGIAFDDGTVTRLAESRYLVTTTTAHAGPVLSHMERHAQIVWPELDVKLVSVTEDWAAIAIAGPRSRAVLQKAVEGIDVSNDAFPFMAFGEGAVFGVPARVFRISFSGELAYEVNVPADFGRDVWEALLEVGSKDGLIPYGTEAMGILRIEKGHIVGGELNGRTTAADLGFERMHSTAKTFIGDALRKRPALQETQRLQLVGLRPVDGVSKIPRGGQLTKNPNGPRPVDYEGEVTSNCESPNMGTPIGLGLLRNGRERHGEVVCVASPLTDQSVRVEVCDPVFVDPNGSRLRG